MLVSIACVSAGREQGGWFNLVPSSDIDLRGQKVSPRHGLQGDSLLLNVWSKVSSQPSPFTRETRS